MIPIVKIYSFIITQTKVLGVIIYAKFGKSPPLPKYRPFPRRTRQGLDRKDDPGRKDLADDG
jgi:hypothetical protein